MRPALVITTCGKAKFQGAAPAGEFYVGSFVKAQKETAKALRPRLGWIVLSNKYGFMHPTEDVIPGPYDSHWGYDDTLPDKELVKQADRWAKDLRPGDIIYCLGAKEYAIQTKKAFPDWVRVIWGPKHLPDRRLGYPQGFMEGLKEVKVVPRVCLDNCQI